MTLDIKIIKKKDYIYSVELKGLIDSETSMQLENELKEIIDEKTKVVIMDMTDVSYVSSAGIRVVIWATKTMEKKKANFAMINLQPQVKKVFDMMNILPILDIFDDEAEADKYIDQVMQAEIHKQDK